MRLPETDIPLEREWKNYFHPKKTLSAIGLRRGMVLADLGCGYGTFAIAGAEIVGKSGLVYAVDIDPKMVRRVRKKAKEKRLANLRVDVGDVSMLRNTDIPKRGVDIALLANIIHGSESKVRLLKGVGRILRREGSIVIINWKVEKTPRGPPMNMRPTEDEMVTYLLSAGYVDPKVLSVPPYHYGVVAHLPKKIGRS